jgi:hypothetical protein
VRPGVRVAPPTNRAMPRIWTWPRRSRQNSTPSPPNGSHRPDDVPQNTPVWEPPAGEQGSVADEGFGETATGGGAAAMLGAGKAPLRSPPAAAPA